jgi:hypothetical protein
MDLDFKHLSLTVTGADIDSISNTTDLACAVHLDERLIDILTPLSPDPSPDSWVLIPIGSSNQCLTLILKQINADGEIGRAQVPVHLMKVFQSDEEYCRLTLPLSTSEQENDENWMEFLKISDVRPPRVHIMFKIQDPGDIQTTENIEIPSGILNPLTQAADFTMSFSPILVHNEAIRVEDEEMKNKMIQLERENRKLEVELMLEKQRTQDVEAMRVELNNSELARLNALQKLAQIKHKYEEDISVLVIQNKQLKQMLEMIGTDNKQQVQNLTSLLENEKLKRQSVISQHNHLAELYRDALDSMKDRESEHLRKINELTQQRSSICQELDEVKSYNTELLRDLNYTKEELRLHKNKDIKTPEDDLRSRVRELEDALYQACRKLRQQEEIYQETLNNLKEMQRSNLQLRNKLAYNQSGSQERSYSKNSEIYWEDIDRRVLEYIDKYKIKCAVMRVDYGIYIFGEKQVEIQEKNGGLVVLDNNVEYNIEQFMTIISNEITPMRIPVRRTPSLSKESSKSKESVDTITTKESEEMHIHHSIESQFYKETDKRKVVVIEDLDQSLTAEESLSMPPSSRRETKRDQRVPIKPYVSKRSPPHKKETKVSKSPLKVCKSSRDFSPILKKR